VAVAATDRPVAGLSDAVRGRILAALMMSMALIALDSTIVATAVPSIVRQLGGLENVPWLFSIYLLTQAATVPLYAKFADMAGRKPVLLMGIAAFVLGSFLCGVAWNMTTLIAARAIQGIGAGAVQPISMTIVGDLYSVEERGRVQGYLASVWGAAAVLGPTLGGVFTDYVSWRWIFWINLPIGGLAIAMLLRNFHERVARRSHRIDTAGSLTLTFGCALLILGLLEGSAWRWTSGRTVAVLGVAVVLLVAFVLVERRAAEPVLPLWVFRRRTLVVGNLASFTVGAVVLGLSAYLPTYVQTVAGTGALVAGFVLASLSIGWPLAASVSGRVYVRIGFRDTALIGSGFTIAGTVGYAFLPQTAPVWLIAVPGLVVGVGLGFAASSMVVALQSVVGWDRRAVVTGSNIFARSIGSAVGVAVFGSIVNTTISSRFAHPPAAIAGALPAGSNVDSLALRGGQLPAPVRAFVRTAFYDATHRVFLALVVVAVLGALVISFMPRRTTQLVFDDPDISAPADA
jgi:EmrB/QacA subfamily drug resistance transporter